MADYAKCRSIFDEPLKVEMKKENKKTNTDFFNLTNDGVPEHVKNYGKNKVVYTSTGENKLKAWF